MSASVPVRSADLSAQQRVSLQNAKTENDSKSSESFLKRKLEDFEDSEKSPPLQQFVTFFRHCVPSFPIVVFACLAYLRLVHCPLLLDLVLRLGPMSAALSKRPWQLRCGLPFGHMRYMSFAFIRMSF